MLFDKIVLFSIHVHDTMYTLFQTDVERFLLILFVARFWAGSRTEGVTDDY